MRLPASLQKKAKAIRLVPEPWLFRATPASGSHWVPASWCSHAHGIEKAGAKHLGISVKINSHNPVNMGPDQQTMDTVSMCGAHSACISQARPNSHSLPPPSRAGIFTPDNQEGNARVSLAWSFALRCWREC